MSNSNNTNFWQIILLALVAGVIVQMLLGDSSSSSSAPATNTNSVEYRYAKERFRQEGFNDSDAATAADAVIKFHEAQKARGQ